MRAKEVIALNQDPLGVAGDLVWKQGPKEAGPQPPVFPPLLMCSRHLSASNQHFAKNVSQLEGNLDLYSYAIIALSLAMHRFQHAAAVHPFAQ